MTVDRDPQVGDVFRRRKAAETYTVTAVGERWFLALPSDLGEEVMFRIDTFRGVALVPPREVTAIVRAAEVISRWWETDWDWDMHVYLALAHALADAGLLVTDAEADAQAYARGEAQS